MCPNDMGSIQKAFGNKCKNGKEIVFTLMTIWFFMHLHKFIIKKTFLLQIACSRNQVFMSSFSVFHIITVLTKDPQKTLFSMFN